METDKQRTTTKISPKTTTITKTTESTEKD